MRKLFVVVRSNDSRRPATWEDNINMKRCFKLLLLFKFCLPQWPPPLTDLIYFAFLWAHLTFNFMDFQLFFPLFHPISIIYRDSQFHFLLFVVLTIHFFCICICVYTNFAGNTTSFAYCCCHLTFLCSLTNNCHESKYWCSVSVPNTQLRPCCSFPRLRRPV